MEPIEPQDEDVIEMIDGIGDFQSYSPKMFELGTLKKEVESKVSVLVRPLMQTLRCRHLPAAGGGWRKGKIQLRIEYHFEFVPDPEEQQ